MLLSARFLKVLWLKIGDRGMASIVSRARIAARNTERLRNSYAQGLARTPMLLQPLVAVARRFGREGRGGERYMETRLSFAQLASGLVTAPRQHTFTCHAHATPSPFIARFSWVTRTNEQFIIVKLFGWTKQFKPKHTVSLSHSLLGLHSVVLPCTSKEDPTCIFALILFTRTQHNCHFCCMIM